MKFSELAGKEIINTFDGSRLGLLGDSDLVINPRTGKILSLVIMKRGLLGMFRGSTEVTISWQSVKKIGQDMIILDVGKRSL
ncbi:MAG: ylmC [Bacillota bacterium]|nr:MAG: ylmC [Bacillota bacterium]MBS3950159.1 YlmC/YmxH family sporulation protein [Peptococcaceae bacterium]